MQITVVQKSVRQSPRKVRLVANAVKKMSVEQAVAQLGQIQRRATLVVLKTLQQAIANAQHNHGLTVADLTIASIEVGEGARYKRFRPVSRGRAHGIIKRTCRITITLSTKAEVKPAADTQVKKSAKKSETAKTAKKDVQEVKKNLPVSTAKSVRPDQPKATAQKKQTVVTAKPTRTKRPVAK